jgi:hypothetical protein
VALVVSGAGHLARPDLVLVFGVQHDEGDAGGGQQGVTADLLAEQPPSQDDGDEWADECVGARQLAGCMVEQPFVGAVAQQAAEDDEIPQRQPRC